MSDGQVLLVATLVKCLVIFILAMHVVPVMVYLERRISAFIQFRIGPNRVGPLGLFQPLADLFKFLAKEDFIPAQASRVLFTLAPVLSAVPPFLVMAMLPLAPPVEIAGQPFNFSVVDTSVGVLFVLALSSLSVYGIAIGGWASTNKYSLLGGLRSSAQLISYELALGISVLAVVCVAGSLDFTQIIEQQRGFFAFQDGRWAGWNVFSQPLAFVIMMVAGYAETNRLPFDLPEAESELVGGYHTEYSATKFALFFMGEYVAMLAISVLTVILFLGGWHLPFYDVTSIESTVLRPLVGFLVLFLKTGFFLFLFIQVRWTLPRFRYDQLMRIGWKVLLPLALLNLLVTGAVVAGS